MPINSILRAVSFASAVFLSIFLPKSLHIPLLFSVVIGHYLLAVFYSKKQAEKVLQNPATYLPALIMTGVGVSMIAFRVSAVIYYGIHHIFTETYFMNNRLGKQPVFSLLKKSRLALSIVSYFILVKGAFYLPFIQGPHMAAALLTAYGFFVFALLFSAGKAMTAAERREHLLFETVGVLGVAAFYAFKLQIGHVISYHALFWFYYGCVKNSEAGFTKLSGYLALTVASTAAIFFLTAKIDFFTQADGNLWKDFAGLTAYIHFTASFALSSLNPAWIRRYVYDVIARPAKSPALAQPYGLPQAPSLV